MLHQLVWILCTVLVVYARSPSKLIGGAEVEDRNYPFYVRIIYKDLDNYLHCGGTIVSPRFVLTAAHCFRRVNASEMGILVGSHSQYEKFYALDEVIKHEASTDGDWYDVALLRTTDEIVYHTGYVEAVQLAAEDYRIDGYPAEIVGYGISTMWGYLPDKLQRLPTSIIGKDKCQYHEHDRWICVSFTPGHGDCDGDSGGPLLADGVQIGLSAHMFSTCASGDPSAYSHIYYYLDWIQHHLNNKDH